MKRDLRIVFMGTPDFAVAPLKKLIENNYNIVGVVTAPDRPAGRGQKLNQSAVKQYAVAQELKVLQPTNLKDESFITALQALKANLQVVVAFRMLPKVVWQLPEYGTFNLHASLLPDYRGAAPINWAVINGEQKTGVTTFFIDEKIDTGEIILQDSTAIEADENAGSLHDRLMAIGSDLVLKTVKQIENGTVSTKPQPPVTNLKSANKLNKDNCKIDWSDTIDNIYNKIRGLSPYPAAWSILINQEQKLNLKIYKAEKEIAEHTYSIGRVLSSKKDIKVAVDTGFIKILELQLPGKKKMDAKALLNGFQFDTNAKML